MSKHQGSCKTAAVAVIVTLAPLCRADVIIDDFRSGSVPRTTVQCSTFDQSQFTNTAGGVRRTRLIAAQMSNTCGVASDYSGAAAVTVGPQGPLTVSSDYGVSHRLELIYGQDIGGNNVPLNLDITEGGLPDRVVRVKFLGLDLMENFVLTVYMNDGGSRSSCGVNLPSSTNGLTLEFPLSAFIQALGVADYADVDYFVLMGQTASVMGATDFAIDSIVVASDHEPGASIGECS